MADLYLKYILCDATLGDPTCTLIIQDGLTPTFNMSMSSSALGGRSDEEEHDSTGGWYTSVGLHSVIVLQFCSNEEVIVNIY